MHWAKQALVLIGLLALTYLTAAIGAVGSASAPEFYGALEQPAWAPPAWLFGPVWTALYGLIGVAAFLVWRSGPWSEVRGLLGLFVVHLAVNALWSWLFFAWQLGFWAFVEVVVLWAFIVYLLVRFWQRQRLAAFLMLPYLAWVTFATALTLALWQGNPDLL